MITTAQLCSYLLVLLCVRMVRIQSWTQLRVAHRVFDCTTWKNIHVAMFHHLTGYFVICDWFVGIFGYGEQNAAVFSGRMSHQSMVHVQPVLLEMAVVDHDQHHGQ